MTSFVTREFFDEPVWRKDRITAINQHFVTAFLDLNLKGDEKPASLFASRHGEVQRGHVAARTRGIGWRQIQ